jgi:hypothetical protein
VDVGNWTVAMVITEMRRAGVFYLRHRHGSEHYVIWRLSERGVAPVSPWWLTTWLHERQVDGAATLAASVLALPWRDELPFLCDDVVQLIDPRKDT